MYNCYGIINSNIMISGEKKVTEYIITNNIEAYEFIFNKYIDSWGK